MSVMDEVGAAKQQSQTDKKTDDAERAVHSAESCGVNLNITAGHCAHCTAPSSTTNPQYRPDGHRSYWLRRLTANAPRIQSGCSIRQGFSGPRTEFSELSQKSSSHH